MVLVLHRHVLGIEIKILGLFFCVTAKPTQLTDNPNSRGVFFPHYTNTIKNLDNLQMNVQTFYFTNCLLAK